MDRVAHVLIVPGETVKPANHKRVAGAQLVVQAATFGALDDRERLSFGTVLARRCVGATLS